MGKPIPDLAALEVEAASFLQTLAPAVGSATLVELSGELGAGKTAFTKVVAKALGVEEVVTSPTFVLEKIYALPAGRQGSQGGAFKRLIHIDAYRLDSGAELAPLGFDELMKDPGNLVFLEWPEKVADALPTPAARVSLAVSADGAHDISYG